jgi:anti-sigma regulatory factor (Ser/Thr protein kinase)
MIDPGQRRRESKELTCRKLRATCSPDPEEALGAINRLMSTLDLLLAGDPGELFWVRLILYELVANALEHGCPGSYRENLVIRIGVVPRKGIIILVGDPRGLSFPVTADPAAAPTGEANVLREKGRGLELVRSLCERVNFRHSSKLISARRHFGHDLCSGR